MDKIPTPSEVAEARSRVAEFVRQWELQMTRKGDRNGDIYGVHFDADADGATLTVADLKALVAASTW
jgi:hypothetical protein